MRRVNQPSGQPHFADTSQQHGRPEKPMPNKARDWVAIGAWAFEIFTALLSVIDVLSDVLVAWQFYDAGHMGWFWMVVASLFVSNCVYTVMAMSMILQAKWDWQVPGDQPIAAVKQFCVVFPFAQVFPLVQWAIEVREQMKDDAKLVSAAEAQQRRQHNDADTTGMGGMQRSDSWTAQATTRAAQDDLDEDEELRLFVRRMHKSFERHMKSNAGFYVETVVEAAPQAVIQLVAVTALGEASGLQLLSMCLSLFSIVTKAYVVCVTYDLRAMAFKAALIAFDVFSLFHVFATVLARDEAVEATVGLLVPSWLGIAGTEASGVPGLGWVGLEVSELAASWMRKDLHLICTALVMLAGVGLFIVLDDFVLARNPRRPDIFAGLVIAGGVLVCFFPAVLALEAAKLSFLLLPLIGLLPDQKAMPFYAISFGFYRRGLAKGRAEAFERLKHVLHFVVTTCAHKQREEDTERITAQQRRSRLRSHNRTTKAGRVRHAAGHSYADFMETALHKLIASGRVQLWSYSRPQYKDPSVPAAPQAIAIPTVTIRQRFRDLCDLPRAGFIKFVQWVRTAPRKDLVLNPMAVAGFVIGGQGVLVYAYAVLFNLAFPFVHAWRYGVAHQNVLQLTCLACAGVCLLTLVALAPFMYRFVSFTFVVREIGSAMSVKHAPCEAKQASTMVGEYHKPPQVAVLKATVSVAVLPFDVTEEVAAFLSMDDLDLRGLTAEQCAALKDRAGDTTN